MDSGRVFLGACTAVAVGAAVALGFAVVPASVLGSQADGGALCVTYPEGSTSAAGWFEMTLENHSASAVRVRAAAARALHDVTLSHLSIAPRTTERAPGLVGTTDRAVPEDFGDVVPVDSGYVVPAHGSVSLVGRLVLREGATSGWLDGVSVTTAGPLGTLTTQQQTGLRGIGIAQPGEGDAMTCGED